VVGDATITFVCGFHNLPEDWPTLSDSEARNARSAVVRLDYAERSILFCCDTVGRHIDDDDNVCIAAERFMVDNADDVRLRSDVIVAPHHGADNGSSVAFIATRHLRLRSLRIA
jgi:competence protein ComEC